MLHINTILEQIFPEYEKQFSYLWDNTSTGILETCLTPDTIANVLVDELFALIKNTIHNKLTIQKSISIKEVATNTFSIRIAQSAFSFQLKQLFVQLNVFNQQIKELKEELLKYYDLFDCYLHTILNVSSVIISCILSEIGNIRRFRNPSTLVSYAIFH